MTIAIKLHIQTKNNKEMLSSCMTDSVRLLICSTVWCWLLAYPAGCKCVMEKGYTYTLVRFLLICIWVARKLKRTILTFYQKSDCGRSWSSLLWPAPMQMRVTENLLLSSTCPPPAEALEKNSFQTGTGAPTLLHSVIYSFPPPFSAPLKKSLKDNIKKCFPVLLMAKETTSSAT